jgi:hypothetical protein
MSLSRSLLLSCLIVGLVSSVIRAEIQEEENVLVLTTSNFEEAVTANKYLLVEFCKPFSICFRLF